MKKLLIICAALTVCSLLMWGISSVQARSSLPQPIQEEVEDEPILATAEETGLPPVVADVLPPDDETNEPELKTEPKTQVPPPLLAFTFDDGPSADYTPLLLSGLRERGVHVTFFMVGARAEKTPEIVLQAYEDGHVIGGHSYDHSSYITKLSATSLKVQLQKTDNIIAEITGDDPPFLLRPPYGAINETVAKRTEKANILWNIDPRDWSVRDAEKIYDTIMERVVDGGVVILHDIYESTVEGALKSIDKLLEEGWQFVTIPELYEVYGIPLQAGGIYRSPEAYTLPDEY